MFLCLFIFGFLFFIPYNTNALDKKVLDCNYQVINGNGAKVDLQYQVYSDGTVKLPFSDGSNYKGDKLTWYHSDKFSEAFYNSFKINKSQVTCPSIYVQKNDLGITVYPKPIYKDSCSGECYNVTAISLKLSNWAKSQKITTKKIGATCSGSSMGFYNRKSYIFPYFRVYTDGTREWSIDGENYVPLTNAISGKINSNEKFSITVNNSLINSIYSSNRLSCPTKIYRCVNKMSGGYSYELSTSSSACSFDELGTNDGQAFGSSYYGGAFGDPTENSTDSNSENSNDEIINDLKDDLNSYNNTGDCNSILGSTKDEESVAWLLQQILNYIKILGPILVVILSSMDFAKSIMMSDDENMKKAEKKLVIRLVLAVALFLVPTLVSVLLNIFGITTDQICALK